MKSYNLIKWKTQGIIWFTLALIWTILSSYTTITLWIALGCVIAGLMSLHMKELNGEDK